MPGELQNFFANVTTSAQFKSTLEDSRFIVEARNNTDEVILAMMAALLRLPQAERLQAYNVLCERTTDSVVAVERVEGRQTYKPSFIRMTDPFSDPREEPKLLHVLLLWASKSLSPAATIKLLELWGNSDATQDCIFTESARACWTVPNIIQGLDESYKIHALQKWLGTRAAQTYAEEGPKWMAADVEEIINFLPESLKPEALAMWFGSDKIVICAQQEPGFVANALRRTIVNELPKNHTLPQGIRRVPRIQGIGNEPTHGTPPDGIIAVIPGVQNVLVGTPHCGTTLRQLDAKWMPEWDAPQYNAQMRRRLGRESMSLAEIFQAAGDPATANVCEQNARVIARGLLGTDPSPPAKLTR